MLIEFPTFEQAEAFYRSEQYKQAKTIRAGVSYGHLLIGRWVDTTKSDVIHEVIAVSNLARPKLARLSHEAGLPFLSEGMEREIFCRKGAAAACAAGCMGPTRVFTPIEIALRPPGHFTNGPKIST